MAIRRYSAIKDSTITNIYKDGLQVRASNANMGASDSLEVFSLYGRASQFENENSRVLIEFQIQDIKKDREENIIGKKGQVQFLLKLSNVEHRESVPSKFILSVNPLSAPWKEGNGLDMESYKDTGEVSWNNSSTDTPWNKEGGDYHEDIQVDKYFEKGTEDLEVDITEIVEKWIDGSIQNNGLIVRMEDTMEQSPDSYYTKKFSSRTSEYFFKRPWIESRTDTSIKDDRAKFYTYNKFVPIENNYNKLYIYNRYKGKLYDFPQIGTGSIYVALYNTIDLPLPPPITQITGSQENPQTILYATGSHFSTGIYTCDVCVNTKHQQVYDVWYNQDRTFAAVGGVIHVRNPEEETLNIEKQYVYNMLNLKSVYTTKEEAVFSVFTRTKKWNPNSYTSVAAQDSLYSPEDIYYKITRTVDDYEVIPYGTGSYNHTRLSRDQKSNYFQLDIGLLEPGYAYSIKFISKDRNLFVESKESFKFRVE